MMLYCLRASGAIPTRADMEFESGVHGLRDLAREIEEKLHVLTKAEDEIKVDMEDLTSQVLDTENQVQEKRDQIEAMQKQIVGQESPSQEQIHQNLGSTRANASIADSHADGVGRSLANIE
jgi:peptidoglycan hydrolase CwlO-like protein